MNLQTPTKKSQVAGYQEPTAIGIVRRANTYIAGGALGAFHLQRICAWSSRTVRAAVSMMRMAKNISITSWEGERRGSEAVAKLRRDGLKVIEAPGDVGAPEDADRMVRGAIDKLGRLDLLVNNAGTPGPRRKIEPKELDHITEGLWDKLLQVNLLGVFRCAKVAAPALRAAEGAIVNTASIAGLGQAGSSLAYSATKAGVVSLTQNLARALAPQVRVNAVAPGAVDSSWIVEWTEEQRQRSIDNALLKRRCTTEDIAGVIVFLGFGAPMVTGQTVIVDGGLTL